VGGFHVRRDVAEQFRRVRASKDFLHVAVEIDAPARAGVVEVVAIVEMLFVRFQPLFGGRERHSSIIDGGAKAIACRIRGGLSGYAV
jgi:hypothetical protein